MGTNGISSEFECEGQILSETVRVVGNAVVFIFKGQSVITMTS